MPLPNQPPYSAATSRSYSESDRRRQRIRLLRHLMAALTSGMVIGMVFLFSLFGSLPYAVSVRFALGTLACSAVLIVVFRTGWNKRFADPSLTVAQLLCAGVMVSYVAYHGEPVRSLLIPFYLTALFFGTFRLPTGKLLQVSAFYVAAYGMAVWMSLPPEVDWRSPAMRRELLRYTELVAVLLWFCWMGGYVASLWSKLRATNDDLKQALHKIEVVASVDELTGVYNRRTIRDIIAREKKRCDRRGEGLCVALLDLDEFKRINDRYGHAAGDQVLKCFAGIVQRSLRDTDAAGRYGGEEFIVVFSQTRLSQTRKPLERIRRHAECTPIDGLPPEERVTVSIGVTQYRPGEDVDAAIGRADAALYRAKASGRNRIALDPPLERREAGHS
jgi:diguanylate cyclase (GGDEF)-like protein